MHSTRSLARVGVVAALSFAVAGGVMPVAHADEQVPTPSPTTTPTPDVTEPAGPTDDAAAPPTTEPTAEPPAGPTAEPTAGPDAGPPTPSALPPGSTVTAAVLPAGPTAPASAPSPVDAYPPYNPQSTCSPTAKPGATYLLNLLVSYFGGRRSQIARACDVGDTSEHKEGRAVDWGLSASNPTEKAIGDQFVEWLMGLGPDNKPGYNARRLGVMYVIWNGYIWSNSSATSTVRQYTGSNPHTDHVHVSLSWFGAYEQTSWWTGVAVPSDAELRSYVRSVYRDLFDRAPDPTGLEGWARALAVGTPRVAVANAITSSAEYRSSLIAGVYREFLSRSPDPAGAEGWLAAMGQGLTIQGLELGFLASDEYYAQAGGTDAGWVQRLYQDVLGRAPSPGEVSTWVATLTGGASRRAVASGFVLSTERLTTVVSGYYTDLLGRGIDPTGSTGWVSAIQAGLRTEQIIGGIIASAEYFTRATRPA